MLLAFCLAAASIVWLPAVAIAMIAIAGLLAIAVGRFGGVSRGFVDLWFGGPEASVRDGSELP